MDNKRYVLMTGASGGIGESLINTFKDSGYHVIAMDRNLPKFESQADNFIQFDCETINEDRLLSNNFFEQVRSILGVNGLDALINNAALQIVKPIGEITLEDFKRTLFVNSITPFYLTQSFYPELEKVKGSVVNISSIHAYVTKPNFTAYATSKAALSGLTRAMAVEMGNKVRVNAISPAAIATPMLKSSFEGMPKEFDQLSSMHPVGRIGNPNEVANLALYLTSEKAGFINGSEFDITGGIHSRLYDPS